MSTHQSLPVTLSYLIAQVSKAHRKRAGELLGEIDLSVGQEMILCELWKKDGVTQTNLAEKIGIRPATVTNALKRMERNGLLERKQDLKDLRISRVYLTKKGSYSENAILEKWNQLENETLTGLKEDERIQLRLLLKKVHTNLIRKG